jgi:hypothetical protein
VLLIEEVVNILKDEALLSQRIFEEDMFRGMNTLDRISLSYHQSNPLTGLSERNQFAISR